MINNFAVDTINNTNSRIPEQDLQQREHLLLSCQLIEGVWKLICGVLIIKQDESVNNFCCCSSPNSPQNGT